MSLDGGRECVFEAINPRPAGAEAEAGDVGAGAEAISLARARDQPRAVSAGLGAPRLRT